MLYALTYAYDRISNNLATNRSYPFWALVCVFFSLPGTARDAQSEPASALHTLNIKNRPTEHRNSSEEWVFEEGCLEQGASILEGLKPIVYSATITNKGQTLTTREMDVAFFRPYESDRGTVQLNKQKTQGPWTVWGPGTFNVKTHDPARSPIASQLYLFEGGGRRVISIRVPGTGAKDTVWVMDDHGNFANLSTSKVDAAKTAFTTIQNCSDLGKDGLGFPVDGVEHQSTEQYVTAVLPKAFTKDKNNARVSRANSPDFLKATAAVADQISRDTKADYNTYKTTPLYELRQLILGN